MSVKFFVVSLMLCWPLYGMANEAQRLQFVEALGKVNAGQAEAEDFRHLSDYVLYPYLESAELQRALRRSPGEYTDKRVRAFIDSHGETAYTRGLRVAWLRRLAKKQHWQMLLDYAPKQGGEELQCLTAQGKVKLQHKDAAMAAAGLWMTGEGRHKACDAVFAWMGNTGALTQELIEARVRLAMAAGNMKLVRYLATKQHGAQRKRTEHWIWAWGNPRDAISRLASAGDKKMDAEMLRQVFQRLATRERDRAAELYDKAMARSNVDGELKQQLAAFIGFRYILNRDPAALHWFQRSGSVALRQIESDWRIRSAIYAESWKDVLVWIDALPSDEQSKPRWKYWQGRALLALGGKEAALQAFLSISGERDFYGFLAADRVNAKYGIVDRPVAPDSVFQAELKKRGDVQRAFELWKAGLADKARSEWNVLLGSLPVEGKLQAGILADEWGWWAQAITSFGRGAYWDDLSRRFPAPHRSLFSAQTDRQGIEKGWAYAITRSESMFAHDARSPVGAVGLMQLMPATGRQVARDERLKWRGTAMLYEPSHNIRLGVRYLSDMRKRFNGHIAQATAAYNAGPHNVNKWQPGRTIPADIWIEAVPFAETHNYLRHVLEFMATYEWRLTGEYGRLSERLPPVKGR